MKNAVILHGKPTKERYFDRKIPKPHKANWFPWIQDKLEDAGISASVPPLPRPYHPVYEAWRRVFESEVVGRRTALVGHSAGAEFILRWLSSSPETSVDKVVLVAPYRDYADKYGEFSEYDLDVNLLDRLGGLTIINSLDDDAPIQRRTHELAEAFPAAKLIELDGYGHFRIGHNMTSPEFPVLAIELLGAARD